MRVNRQDCYDSEKLDNILTYILLKRLETYAEDYGGEYQRGR